MEVGHAVEVGEVVVVEVREGLGGVSWGGSGGGGGRGTCGRWGRHLGWERDSWVVVEVGEALGVEVGEEVGEAWQRWWWWEVETRSTSAN